MASMFLYILRHAWAGHFGDPNWPDDSRRPLTPEGRKRFTNMAQHMVERGVEPAVIGSSPYVRCRETADLFAEQIPGSSEVVSLSALRPGSDLQSLLHWTREQREKGDILWVGHAPDVSHLAAAMIGDRDVNIRFAKATCSAIRLDGPIDPGCGDLHWVVTAKILGV